MIVMHEFYKIAERKCEYSDCRKFTNLFLTFFKYSDSESRHTFDKRVESDNQNLMKVDFNRSVFNKTQ